MFLPHDPANKYLTDDDRTQIRSSTGVDVRADGDIVSSINQSVNAHAAALDVVGQIASDRANKVVTGRLDDNYLDPLFGQYGVERLDNDPQSKPQQITTGYDFRA